MVLTRQALSEYDARIQRLGDGAYDTVYRRVTQFMKKFPGASVGMVRDFTIESVTYAVSVYGDAASTCAADLYDEMAEASGAKLPPAVLDTTDVSGFIDKEVRYQAGKLIAGKVEEFANAAAAKATDQVSRRANETMRRNAKRDGLRYARVPMGGETCTFCIMLASRGFVYKSAKTAGEGNHFHANCRCKVVPQFDKRGRETKVEGYDPDELLQRWAKFSEIDGRADIPPAGRERMKAMLNANPELSVMEAENKWVEQSKGYASNMEAVGSKAYKRVVSDIVGEGNAENVWKDMRHTLKVKSGKPRESLYIYDLTDGMRIGSVTDSKDDLQVIMPRVIGNAAVSASRDGHSVMIMHNHPGSSLPSAADVASVARCGAKFGIIACHDGSIIKFSPVDKRYESYNEDELEAIDRMVSRIIKKKRMQGQTEPEYIDTIKTEAGVNIELFVIG